MRNTASKIVLIFLVLTCVFTLSIRNGQQHGLPKGLTHQMKLVEHDPSSTYSLYKNNLDAIRDGIVLTPPAALPTSSLTVTTFTKADCQIMTEAEKNQLGLQVVLIKGKLDKLQEELNCLPIDCNNYKTRLDVQNQQTYLQTIQDILNKNCSIDVTLRPSTFQTNLNNDRWLLGNLTFPDVVKEYSERSMTNQFVTNCPDEKPFYVEGSGCINCEGETNYFNLQSKKCSKCEQGKTYDIKLRNCKIDETIKNQTNKAPQTNQTNTIKNNTSTNTSTPATNSTIPTNTTQNETKVNTTTPNVTTPNTTNATHPTNTSTTPNNTQNATKVNATTPNITTPNVTAPNATTPNVTAPNATQNATKVNSTSPILNNTNATNATANATHPLNTTNTTSPSNNTQVNATTPVKPATVPPTPVVPVLPANASNPKSSNRILAQTSSLPVNNSKDIPCPEDKPFYNGTVCIQCNAPNNLFDISTKACTACPEQHEFNETTNKCDKLNNDFLTNLSDSRIILAGMPAQYWELQNQQIKAKNSSVTICSSTKPFYNGKQCINCTGTTPYFNLQTRKCQACSGNFTFDKDQRDCIDNRQSEFGVQGSTLKMSGTLFSHQKELLQRMHLLKELHAKPRHQMTLSQ